MKALITGITGQVGSYLAEWLLADKYEVHGLTRRSPNTPENIAHIIDKITLHRGDIDDYNSIRRIIEQIRPDEIYNYAAISNVPDSFADPQRVIHTNGNGLVNILETVRKIDPYIKVMQAGTSELFGNKETPQNEETRMQPKSPYAVGKLVAHNMANLYRDAYGLYVNSFISFNHESERRGEEFVTRKITKAVANIEAGFQKKLKLGNLEGRRDWGYAKEYAYWHKHSMSVPHSDSYVIGTGETHSVREFVEEAFAHADLNPWDYVEHNTPEDLRPLDIEDLRADFTKARLVFGFGPSVKFKELVEIMVKHDQGILREEIYR